MSSSILMIAAEASSCFFAEKLIQHWKAKDYQFFGVGNLKMEQMGFHRLGKAEEMAVMGLVEVLKHYSEIKSVYQSVLEEVKKRNPKVAILLDYPGFNLRLAKDLKALGITVIYYVSPQIWAWKKGRVKTLQQYCDKVLCLFPFEMEFYKNHQVPCEFVGHAVLDDLDDKYLDFDETNHQRRRRGIGDHEIVLGLMPGSRKGELDLNLPIQIETARILYRQVPDLRVVILLAPTLDKAAFQDRLEKMNFPYMILQDEPVNMIQITDLILATSGTATLFVALLQKPMVIMYRFKWLTGVIAKIIVRGVRFFGLPNLISGKEVVPERWQEKANPEHLSQLILNYIKDQDYRLSVQKQLGEIKGLLGDKGATMRVANIVEKYL